MHTHTLARTNLLTHTNAHTHSYKLAHARAHTHTAAPDMDEVPNEYLCPITMDLMKVNMRA